MHSIPLVFAVLSFLVTSAISSPLHPLPSLYSPSDVNFTLNFESKNVKAGSQNNTLFVACTYYLAYTALIGSECVKCGPGNYNSKKSLEDGYLEYLSEETSAINAT